MRLATDSSQEKISYLSAEKTEKAAGKQKFSISADDSLSKLRIGSVLSLKLTRQDASNTCVIARYFVRLMFLSFVYLKNKLGK